MAANQVLAEHLGQVGNLPVYSMFQWQGGPAPDDVASAAMVAHLEASVRFARGALDNEPPDGPVLLVASTMRTGWALTLAAAMLREAGWGEVLALVLHQQP